MADPHLFYHAGIEAAPVVAADLGVPPTAEERVRVFSRRITSSTSTPRSLTQAMSMTVRNPANPSWQARSVSSRSRLICRSAVNDLSGLISSRMLLNISCPLARASSALPP